MDFEDAKENIQPLASGRNVSILTSSLTYHSDLQKQREFLEAAIHNYEGDDPLDPWYEYILWVEQSYPSGGNESGLKKLLLKCLTTFEDDKRYYQDRRLIRIFIKYIDTEENPVELYQELFNSGIGTMISDLYICWAYYYDLVGNFRKADGIFRKGLEVKAQPYDELEHAYKHFGFNMSQRILYQDETSQEEMMTSLREKRQVLTSLRPHKKKIGSIRTGSVVKNLNPGKIKVQGEATTSSNYWNAKVKVFEDENKNPNSLLSPLDSEEHHIPVVKNIIDSVRKKENLKEPGPWTKGLKKRGHLFDNTKCQDHEIGFTILEDDTESENNSTIQPIAKPLFVNYEDNYTKGIQLPKNFAQKNYPQSIWKVEIVSDDEILPGTFPQYNKLFHYPKPDIEFSTEEILAYRWLLRNGIENKFTEMCKTYLGNEIGIGVRMYKNFPKKNTEKDDNFKLSEFKPQILANSKFIINIAEVYCMNEDKSIQLERQFEEILFEKIKSGKRKVKFNPNETIMVEEGMDETQCSTNIVGRKSIFPSRKSLAPLSLERRTIFKPKTAILEEEQNITDTGSDLRHKKVMEVGITEKEKEYNKKVSTDLQFPKIFKNLTAMTKESAENVPLNHLISNVVFEGNNIAKEALSNTLEGNLSIPQTTMQLELTLNTEKENSNTKIKCHTKGSNLGHENNIKETKISDNFDIYEDPEESFKFKQPHPVKPKTSVATSEDVFEKNTYIKIPQHRGFEVDESFSTQNFNLFIRPQSVSTPIGKKSNVKEPVNEQNGNFVKSTSVVKNNLIEEEQKSSDQSNHSNVHVIAKDSQCTPNLNVISSEGIMLSTSLQYNRELEAASKRLSTIMEISEQNTMATGSTKSSVDTPGTIAYDPETMKCTEIKNISKDGTKINKSSDGKDSSISKMSSSEAVSNIKIFEGIQKSIENSSIVFNSQKLDKNDRTEIRTDFFMKGQFSMEENGVNDLQQNTNTSKNLEKGTTSEPHVIKNKEDNAISRKGELKAIGDVSQSFNMRSIQIFEEKTETVPKILLKKAKDIDEAPQDDLYDYFAKTPEKKGLTVAISKENFEFNDSLTFSKLKDFTLPKYPENNKFLMKDSPIAKIARFSCIKDHEEISFNKQLCVEKNISDASIVSKQDFTEQLPTLPNLKDLALPKLANKEPNFSFENSKYIAEDELKLPQLSSKQNNDTKYLDQELLQKYKHINEQSLHIKEEILDDGPQQNLKHRQVHGITSRTEHSIDTKTPYNYDKLIQQNDIVNEIPCSEMRSLRLTENKDFCNIQGTTDMFDKDVECINRSIYSKYSFKTPVAPKDDWSVDENCQVDDFVHFNPENLDQTIGLINDKLLDGNINPFSTELTNAFLESIDFTNHIQQLDSCELRGKINRVKLGNEISIRNKIFIVGKIIGEGSFGTVYSAKEKFSGKMYALKQEKPANLWEYYICLELRSRVVNNDMLPAFMDIEYSLIGNNASLYVSQLSSYGSFISICNSYKRKTNKNLDEYIVMILTEQILQIIDHLHALKIIHADIKPDNFLLMTKLSYPKSKLAIQLIDFGVSIDMELFQNKKQTFMYKHEREDFKCIEMRENRPWTYQTDLFGVAGTIHVLLYGKYMDVEKSLGGIWAPKQRFPRYFKKDVWGPIFQNLLNVRDCELMPNLQNLRETICEALFDKEKYVIEKVNEFNLCLNN